MARTSSPLSDQVSSFLRSNRSPIHPNNHFLGAIARRFSRQSTVRHYLAESAVSKSLLSSDLSESRELHVFIIVYSGPGHVDSAGSIYISISDWNRGGTRHQARPPKLLKEPRLYHPISPERRLISRSGFACKSESVALSRNTGCSVKPGAKFQMLVVKGVVLVA